MFFSSGGQEHATVPCGRARPVYARRPDTVFGGPTFHEKIAAHIESRLPDRA